MNAVAAVAASSTHHSPTRAADMLGIRQMTSVRLKKRAKKRLRRIVPSKCGINMHSANSWLHVAAQLTVVAAG